MARARNEASTVAEVGQVLERLAPARDAEPWDNVGLVVGDPGAPVRRVMLAIDYTAAVAAEAVRARCELVVAYHPPIFEGVARVLAGGVVYEAVRTGTAIVSLHTALDVAPGGTNDVLAAALGLTDTRPLRPRPPPSAVGMGRIGTTAPLSRDRLVQRVKTALGLERVLVAGPRSGRARVVAVCAGACGEYLDDALASGADVFVTGELKHHHALRAAAGGLTVVCTLHSNSERAALAAVRAHLRRTLPGLDVRLARSDRDPFVIV